MHVLSSASIEIFESNNLVAFQNFSNIETQLPGGWMVARCDIIVSTKDEQVVSRDWITYSLRISLGIRKFLGNALEKKCSSGLENLSLLIKIYVLSNEEPDFPIICFKKSKVPKKKRKSSCKL